ncbi:MULTISPECIES: hypothetical protein [Sporomusa]|jgi:hypothetical protein|uniref:Iron-only hydrogenase system regulator n=2 Tax=Sporomusa TaxID=2375 RepID=A0ABP2C5X6_9FIRM|nr:MULTISPECIES: hypothetical protein [Sporomusa]MCM0761026.1 hypothetical protein [Sporomusa sphaeroides DSM 2875]OLS55956.1 hypothetical protein SPSPH_32860 [Sporomusa sphaeroides DSM 2875]CVK18956.1 hypothetical protein SSPH_01600 [Sporomusa sphaeroides DSM 2875]SCM79450.1 conserved hypothetical protein [uncultured Sporomusa sp.]HML34655.1 hypothetical protein [Sporomusa sphaeroides]
MSNCATIMAIIQGNRLETAVKVQDVLTKYGCYIRVRLGLHDAAVNACTNSGIILLQLCGEDVPVNQMEQELKQIPEVKVKYMLLD